MVTVTSILPTSSSWLPQGRALVAEDLERAPDDGHRYELIDGLLVVSAAPVPVHQRVAFRLAVLLDAACPPELEVFVAPLDVRLADDTQMQPDVLVAHRADIGEKNLPAAPLLAVEVLSPSTRGIDLLLKKERLERAGCPSYWVVDPVDGGRLLAWELDATDHYRQVADVGADESWTAAAPYAVTISPGALLS